jgi:Uma2 family endonuclease
MSIVLEAELVTPEQLAALPNAKDYEIVEGRLKKRQMGNKSARIGSRLNRLLDAYVDAHDLGWVFNSDAGYRMNAALPNNVRKPDVSFVNMGRLPDETPSDAYDRLAPDLAVEVVSPTDTISELDEKIEEYLTAGVRLVWVVHPDVQRVDVYRLDGSTAILRTNDELNGENVVPGFRCQVADLFPKLRTK